MKDWLRRLATGVTPTAFACYLAQGHLSWLPASIPIAVMLAGALIWLVTEPKVREALVQVFKTETSKIIHPDTRQPVQQPQWRKRRAACGVVIVIVSLIVGVVAKHYRANSLQSVVRPPPATKESVEELTLHYLFKHDFDNTLRVPRPLSVTENATGQIIKFETQVYLDIPARTKFIGVYLPFTNPEDTFHKCKVFLRSIAKYSPSN